MCLPTLRRPPPWSLALGTRSMAAWACSVSHGASSDRDLCMEACRQCEAVPDHHCGTQRRTPFLCSFQKQSIADMVETGTDFPLPPEPSARDNAFRPCCWRVLLFIPGMILAKPLRDPAGKGQQPASATRSECKMWGTAMFGLKPARRIASTILLHLYAPQPSTLHFFLVAMLEIRVTTLQSIFRR